MTMTYEPSASYAICALFSELRRCTYSSVCMWRFQSITLVKRDGGIVPRITSASSGPRSQRPME